MLQRIPDELIRQVIRDTDIVNIISRYVKLTPAGRTYKGRCPFHSEKTASFSVDPVRKIFKCFGGGCGKSGNVITFLMEIERFSFPEAFRSLASECGIEYSRKVVVQTDEDRKKQGVFEANRIAMEFFRQNLSADNPVAAQAREYLHKRGFDKESIRTFNLGLALDEWSGLFDHIRSVSSNPKYFEAASLIKQGRRGYFDFFRNRVIVPIIDGSGQVLAFGGRVFREESGTGSLYSEPKYLNSPETMVFNKSKVFYGIDLARDDIRRSNTVVFVEGYMDRMALHRAGISNSLAVLGTAFTEQHFKRINSLADNIYVMFDTDEAGQTATERVIRLFHQFGRTCEVVQLDGYKDVDELISSGRDFNFETLKSFSCEDIDFIIKRTLGRFDSGRTDYRKNVVSALAWIILGEKSRLTRQKYSLKVAQALKADRNLVFQEIEALTRQKGHDVSDINSGKQEPTVRKKEITNYSDFDLWILAFAVTGMNIDEEHLVKMSSNELRQYAEKVFYERIKTPEIISDATAMFADKDFFDQLLDRIRQIPDDKHSAQKMTEQILIKFKKGFIKKKMDEIKNKLIELSGSNLPEDPGMIEFISALDKEFKELKREYNSGSEA